MSAQRDANGMPIGGAYPFQPTQPIQDFSVTTEHQPDATDVQKVKSPMQLQAEQQRREADSMAVLASERDTNERMLIEQREQEKMAAEAGEMKAQAAELQKRNDARNQHIAALSATNDARAAEMEKASNFSSYWADRSTPARILSAVMVGLGEGANRGDGPSSARQILDASMASDRQQKLDHLNATKLAKEHSEDALRFGLTEEENYNVQLANIQKARLASLQKGLDLAIKKIPRAEAAGMAATAVIQQKQAENTMASEALHERVATRVQQGTDVATTVGTKGAAPQKPNLTVYDAEGNPRTANSQAEAHELNKQKGALDSTPEILDRLRDLSEKRGRLPSLEWDRAAATAIGNLLEKKKDITGALTPNDIANAKSKFMTGLLAGPEAVGHAYDEYWAGVKGGYQSNIKAMSTGEAPESHATPTPGGAKVTASPAPEPSPRSSSSARQADIEALKWAEQHRGDPRAEAIRRKVKARAGAAD